MLVQHFLAVESFVLPAAGEVEVESSRNNAHFFFFGISTVIKVFSIAERKFERVSIVGLEVIFLYSQPLFSTPKWVKESRNSY